MVCPSSLNIVIPFSLRQPVKDLKNFKLNNDMVGIPFDLHIGEDFDKALVEVQKKTKVLKNSTDPFGTLFAF